MILTPLQMADAEKYSQSKGVSLAELMDNAGAALAEAAGRTAYQKMLKKAVIICGKGNNGGDGFVCAEILSGMGLEVTVALVCGEPATQLARDAFSKLGKGVRVVKGDLSELFSGGEIVIDAVFGTGFKGELPGNIKEIFRQAEECGAVKIACDVPSGVNCLTGKVSDGCLKCDETVTFHAVKVGCLMRPTKFFCGKITVVDIGIPQAEDGLFGYTVSLAGEEFPRSVMPERPSDGHKGSFGRLTAACGSKTYRGAAMLSVGAALRSGVGMTELCSEKEVIEGMWASLPEAIYTETDMNYPEAAADILLEKASRSTAILAGCGLGCSEETGKFIERLITESKVPLIIDADGINSICPNIDVLLNAKAEVILTPHPAELARICSVTIEEAVENRLELAVNAARKLNVIISAKGADTFVTDGKEVILCSYGNTSLSKGGSGDILAGITASLAAQGVRPLYATAAASVILGKTAEFLSLSASERGITGRDIVNALPYTFKKMNI